MTEEWERIDAQREVNGLKRDAEGLRKEIVDLSAKVNELTQEKEALRLALRKAADEIGVPDESYPANIANASTTILIALLEEIKSLSRVGENCNHSPNCPRFRRRESTDVCNCGMSELRKSLGKED